MRSKLTVKISAPREGEQVKRIRGGRKWIVVSMSLLAAAAILMVTPAGAHINRSVDHVWSHIRDRADARYEKKTQTVWAMVNHNGTNYTLARGRGATGVATHDINTTPSDASDDAAIVSFNRSVATCNFTPAAITFDDLNSSEVTASATPYTANNKVLVQPGSSSGSDSSHAFSLLITC